ncbi:MAG TPA: uracil-DNA glycosylase [Polyangia bacterium]|jgi:uracil-DNA glycosylase family 4|nr:uracil-DNA glycosylase [Polyangia bacterium]
MATDDEARVDARAELRALVGQVRTNLGARQRAGLMGVPLRPTARKASAVPAPADAKAAATSVPPSSPTLPDEPGERGLAVVREDLGDCKRCKLAPTRTNLVFGVGNPNAHLVFVGEAPGADEDAQGEPFVGKAGQLLTKMIEAMGYAREDVYICNILKCRPPGNRNPEPDEIEKCEPFLKGQLAALRPRVIVALGKFAAQCLLRDDTPISRLRGSFRSYEGIQLMPTFHPAYLLRDPTKKKEAWADLKAVNAALKRLGLDPPRPPAGES